MSDFLKEGYMTWIFFIQCPCLELIHVCYFLIFPRLSKKLLQLLNLKRNSLLSSFYSSVQAKKSMNGVYKTNIDHSFIWEW